MNSSMPLLKVENLSHQFSSQLALNNVSFELNENAIIGLLGSNGAGKSTMMNIICGVLTQTSGKVLIGGYDNLAQRIDAKKLIGFLPQKPPLHMDLTVNEYLTYTAQLRRLSRSDVKPAVEDVLDRCGIKHFRNRLIKNLSGGYQQRVGIAQAIIHNPKFIVLDEPTNGLDPNQILEIRKLIKDIAKDRIVLLSTHILQEVQAMCDHILMIEHGEFVFTGTMSQFNNSVVSNVLIMHMDNLPNIQEILSIDGIENVEETEKNIFKITINLESVSLNNIINISTEKEWGLVQIYREKVHPDEIFKHFSKGIKNTHNNLNYKKDQ